MVRNASINWQYMYHELHVTDDEEKKDVSHSFEDSDSCELSDLITLVEKDFSGNTGDRTRSTEEKSPNNWSHIRW